jgi:hypothetical protein
VSYYHLPFIYFKLKGKKSKSTMSILNEQLTIYTIGEYNLAQKCS